MLFATSRANSQPFINRKKRGIYVALIVALCIVSIVVFRLWEELFAAEEDSGSLFVTVASSAPYPLYYFSTREGLASHFVQLEVLWHLTASFDRTIIVVPFSSPHFPDTHDVRLCEYFEFPSRIICTNTTKRIAARLPFSPSCAILNGTSEKDIQMNEFPAASLARASVVNEFDLATAHCVVGFLGLIPGHEKIRSHSVVMPWDFQARYYDLLQKMKSASHLPTHNGAYAVFHWRRGDQLRSPIRCRAPEIVRKSGGFQDSSINCGSVDDFITTVRNLTRKNVPEMGNSKFPIYIATNEEDPKIRNRLAAEGFLHLDVLLKNARIRKINSVEKFIMELMLMCDTRYLFLFGSSTSKETTEECRHYFRRKTNDSSSGGRGGGGAMEKKRTFYDGIEMNFLGTS
jgi:hypothetical protein